MGLTHGVRNLVLGSALTAGAVAVVQGGAAAEAGPTLDSTSTPPAERAREEAPAVTRALELEKRP